VLQVDEAAPLSGAGQLQAQVMLRRVGMLLSGGGFKMEVRAVLQEPLSLMRGGGGRRPP
jgi:hypothetical protein